MKPSAVTVCLLAICCVSRASAQVPGDGNWQDSSNSDWQVRANLPGWVADRAHSSGIDRKLDLSLHLNPFYQSCDFDGDGVLDAAVLVKGRRSGKIGIAIFRRASDQPHVVGASYAGPNGSDNLTWMDSWSIARRQDLSKSPYEDSPPKAKGCAIEAVKLESAGGAIYWDGNAFVWYQIGD